MKHKIAMALCLALILVSVSGCAQSQDADVANEPVVPQQELADYKPHIMLGNSLYETADPDIYSLRQLGETEEAGEIISAVPASELPTESGQTNAGEQLIGCSLYISNDPQWADYIFVQLEEDVLIAFVLVS